MARRRRGRNGRSTPTGSSAATLSVVLSALGAAVFAFTVFFAVGEHGIERETEARRWIVRLSAGLAAAILSGGIWAGARGVRHHLTRGRALLGLVMSLGMLAMVVVAMVSHR